MNSLAEKYGDKLAILGFPSNQFGHQTNEGNDEFLNILKHVRPGNGFEPAKTVTIFEKCDVNGLSAAPVFKWLKSEQVRTPPQAAPARWPPPRYASTDSCGGVSLTALS
jgi:glutathione peroxidase